MKEIIIAMNQAAPIGLVGVTPSGINTYDAKISNTTTDMEWKRSGEPYYYGCSPGTTLVTLTTTYYVRYKAKDGYYVGADAIVTIPEFVNQDQAAPTGLVAVPTTSYKAQNGKISNTTDAMEYKLSTDSTYETCDNSETAYLSAGTYQVRYKAKTGYNAGAETTVVITAPDPKSDATLQSLMYVCTYNGSTEYSSVPNFDPSITTYNVPLHGNNYGKTFDLNPYATDAPFASVTYSAVTVNTGTYVAVLKAEITAEDGITKQVYTVNITVERRSASASISPVTYTTGSGIAPLITLSLTNRDGDSCSLESLNGTVSMKDRYSAVIDPAQYTVDEEHGTITIDPGYFDDKSASELCYFHITVTSDGYKIEVPAMYAPFITIN